MFLEKKGLESSLLLTTLIGDNYFLHIINEIVSMIDLLKDLVYNYKYRENIYTIWIIHIIILDEETW